MDADKKLQEIHAHSLGAQDWLTRESDYFIKDHINNMIVHSKRIRRECEQTSIPYFDTSQDFSVTLDQVVAFLEGREGHF